MSKAKKFFWNYKLKAYSVLEKEIESDDEATLYIPNTRFANTAYFIFRNNGEGIRQSMLNVLNLYWRNE